MYPESQKSRPIGGNRQRFGVLSVNVKFVENEPIICAAVDRQKYFQSTRLIRSLALTNQ